MQFLLIEFDRYDTHHSTHRKVTADSPMAALLQYYDNELTEDEVNLTVVNDTFACEAGEEVDILIYTMDKL